MPVGDHAGAPVADLDRLHLDSVHLDRFSPIELVHLAETAHQIPVAPVYHDRQVTRQGTEGAEVGMVHVGVREEQQVQSPELPGAKRRLDEAPGSELGQPAADSDPSLERGVGEHPRAPEIEQHGRVAQPRGGEAIGGPTSGVGPVRRARDGGKWTPAALADRVGGVSAGERQPILQHFSRHLGRSSQVSLASEI
jgi:hypothetical protein